jgi:hypothetical protein
VDALPKTIADAVRICQELSIPYLWIDSLCIIQGNKADFGREGYHMDAIYSGSHLTIFAKAAVSCKGLQRDVEKKPLAPSSAITRPGPGGLRCVGLCTSRCFYHADILLDRGFDLEAEGSGGY